MEYIKFFIVAVILPAVLGQGRNLGHTREEGGGDGPVGVSSVLNRDAAN